MTDVRPERSTMDGTGRDRPTDPEFGEPTDRGPRPDGPRSDGPRSHGPRSDDLSEGELSEQELGEDEANAPAPAHLPRSDVDTATADEGPADGGPARPATGPAPGEVEPPPVAALWPADSADGFRERWREIQLRFVDEPRAAAEQADDLVEEAVSALTTSLQRVRAELGQWRSTRSEDSGETEHLRVAVQRYREFLNSVVAL